MPEDKDCILAWGVSRITNDDDVIAEVRFYPDGTSSSMEQTVLTRSMQYITAKRVIPTTVKAGVAELIKQYDCNIPIEYRYYNIHNRLFGIDYEYAVATHKLFEGIRQRDKNITIGRRR